MSATMSISAGKREKDGQHARQSKTWATIGQASWLALTVIAVALVLAIASPLMHTFETVCTTSVCKDQQLGTAQARQLQSYGLTLADYAHYMFGVRAVFIGL